MGWRSGETREGEVGTRIAEEEVSRPVGIEEGREMGGG